MHRNFWNLSSPSLPPIESSTMNICWEIVQGKQMTKSSSTLGDDDGAWEFNFPGNLILHILCFNVFLLLKRAANCTWWRNFNKTLFFDDKTTRHLETATSLTKCVFWGTTKNEKKFNSDNSCHQLTSEKKLLVCMKQTFRWWKFSPPPVVTDIKFYENWISSTPPISLSDAVILYIILAQLVWFTASCDGGKKV